MEEWKPLKRIPHYEVSNTGRVRSLRFNKQKLLKACETKDGYLLYCLSDNKKKFTSYAHRLVAEVFLDPPASNQLVVNHKNKNRQDNSVQNLEWITVNDNFFHGLDSELYKQLRELQELANKMNTVQLEEVIKFSRSISN
jgi:hypothetical protein